MNDAEAEVPILWRLDVESWLVGKDLDAGEVWRQEDKGAIENEIVGWQHWLNRHEFEQAPGDSEGQGSLVCSSPGGCKELQKLFYQKLTSVQFSSVTQLCSILCNLMDCSMAGIVNKAEVDDFLDLSGFFYDPADVGNLISCSSAFSKSSLNIWKFIVHVLLNRGLENWEHYFASVWDECSCAVVWTFFGIAFLCDWNENWPFPVPWPLLSFPNLLSYGV